MALFSRSLFSRPNHAISSILSRSISYLSPASSVRSSTPFLSSLVHRLRHLAAASVELSLRLAASQSARGFATRSTSSSLNDQNPNRSNRPTVIIDGCDFEHWLVVMEKPEGDPTREDIIDSYIKTLAKVVGSEEEARMKIYSVSTRHYFAFGALVPEYVSTKIKELPGVRWVLPDSYLNVDKNDYGGEPFINGQAVPYDPEYHKEWVENYDKAAKRRGLPSLGNQGGVPPQNNQGGPPPQFNQGGAPPHYTQGAAAPHQYNNMGGVTQSDFQNQNHTPSRDGAGVPTGNTSS